MLLIALAVVVAVAGLAKPGISQTAVDPTGFAVVELFTSQGCSSCPPADRLLTQLDELASEQNLPIFTLSMHVDYWNRLGWTDPYSSRQFTQRQHAYADAANSRSVYTPQMVVNGEAEFVGSDSAKAKRAIIKALKRPSVAKVELTAQAAAESRAVNVQYQVTGAAPGTELVICLVADPSPNEVPRGENAGRRLEHHAVVHSLQAAAIKANDRGAIAIALPNSIRGAKGVEIVALVQDKATRRIDGAGKATVTQRLSSRPAPL